MKNFTNHYYKALMLLLLIPFLNSCSTQSALNTNKLDVQGTVAVTTPAPTAEQPVDVLAVEETEIAEAVAVAEKSAEPTIEKEKFGSNKAIAAKNPKGYKVAKKIAKTGQDLAEVNPVTEKVLQKADKIASKITKKQGITGAGSSADEGGGSLLYVGLVLLIAGILVGIVFDQLGYALAAVGVVLIIVWVLLALL